MPARQSPESKTSNPVVSDSAVANSSTLLEPSVNTEHELKIAGVNISEYRSFIPLHEFSSIASALETLYSLQGSTDGQMTASDLINATLAARDADLGIQPGTRPAMSRSERRVLLTELYMTDLGSYVAQGNGIRHMSTTIEGKQKGY